ncbi:GNAT family N-acetyltransferase [Amycolatopsis endophytica]|uniref:RimJ/RimL family protein N-acetyltransferase n=1 Tax=Amycolatopsis endophytica TaxID=860233 RepID=A0A853AWS9_9PSEU|nr:GNAT family N-acetyltransferase [Amycolatopsis endophytica]NYI87118.1 RimJ/RimL family protein N-acetyltransferase [Amycolatopsis endophytica]
MSVEWREIRTDRLLLRALDPDDRDDVVEIQTDPRTNVHHPGPPGVDETEVKLTAWLEHWKAHGFGYVAVVALDSREVVGIGGLQHLEFGGVRLLNLYYRFRPEAWGRGYATEMATAVVEWAEREMPELPVQISVNIANAPSLRVAERLGFTAYTETFYDGAVSRHFRRL